MDAERPTTAQTFALRLTFDYDKALLRVWRALTQDIGAWWNERIHDEARTLLAVEPGGAWKQEWSNGGALLGHVIHVHSPVVLRLAGPLAMTTPAMNTLELVLEELDEATTRLHLSHLAFGLLDDGADETYTEVWSNVFGTALARYIGSPPALPQLEAG